MNAATIKLEMKGEARFFELDGRQKQLTSMKIKINSPTFLRELTTTLRDLEAILAKENSRLAVLLRKASQVKFS